LFSRTLHKQLLFAGLPLALFALSAPWVFALAFGENWREAGIYCSFLCPMLVLYVTNVVLATTLEVLERLELQLQRSLVSLACIAAGVVVPKLLGVPPRTAILMLSLASSLGYLYTLWTTWRAIPRQSGRVLLCPHACQAGERTIPASSSTIPASTAAIKVKAHV
jgi:O-antigen/teichoic acid export membrane protein